MMVSRVFLNTVCVVTLAMLWLQADHTTALKLNISLLTKGDEVFSIQASPEVFRAGTTDQLKVSCKFDSSELSSVYYPWELVSVSLLKYVGADNEFEELAVSKKSGDLDIKKAQGGTYESSGDSSEMGIVGTYTNPSRSEAGIYACWAVMDKRDDPNGHKIFFRVGVTVEVPLHLDDLKRDIEKLYKDGQTRDETAKTLAAQLADQQTVIVAQGEIIKNLSQLVARQGEIIRSQGETIVDLSERSIEQEKAIETLGRNIINVNVTIDKKLYSLFAETSEWRFFYTRYAFGSIKEAQLGCRRLIGNGNLVELPQDEILGLQLGSLPKTSFYIGVERKGDQEWVYHSTQQQVGGSIHWRTTFPTGCAFLHPDYNYYDFGTCEGNRRQAICMVKKEKL